MHELNQVLQDENDTADYAFEQVFATHPVVLLLVQVAFFKLHNA